MWDIIFKISLKGEIVTYLETTGSLVKSPNDPKWLYYAPVIPVKINDNETSDTFLFLFIRNFSSNRHGKFYQFNILV